MLAMSKKKIVLTGGGTAGHVFPLIEVARELRDDNYSFLYFGSGAQIEKEKLQDKNIQYTKIISGKVRRYFTLESFVLNIIDIFKFIIGTIQAFIILVKTKPELIFSKGGYASLPVIISGALLRIPIFIHESDLKMGLVNRISFMFARQVFLSFPEDAYNIIKSKTFYTGIPLRKEFFSGEIKVVKDQILVMGGSSGAVTLNDKIIEVLPSLAKKYRIIHQTGDFDFKRVKNMADQLSSDVKEKYKPISFSNDIVKLIRESEIIISRSGATTIFECATSSKPLIVIPLPEEVTDHQMINAKYLEKNKMALVFDQRREGNELLNLIEKMSKDKEIYSSNINLLSFPLSAEVIARNIDELLGENLVTQASKIHFIGSMGVSMRQIFEISKSLDKDVSGSDIKLLGHSLKNIRRDLDLVVYSSSITPTSPAYSELAEAKRLNIYSIKRSKFIGELMKGRKSVTVSGMHGKTTITAAISHLLEKAQVDPSYLIGAPDRKGRPSFKFNHTGAIIVEACEYDGSFLDMKSTYGVISNIEEEHMDYFKGGISEIIKSFSQYISNIACGGKIFVNWDDDNVRKLIKLSARTIMSGKIEIVKIGFKQADYQIIDFESCSSAFAIKHNGHKQRIKMNILGQYNVFNLAVAYAVAVNGFGLEAQQVAENLETFVGVARRFEKKYEKNNIVIYDDYAHHPTEIKSLFEMIENKFASKNKVVLYEQHQQERFNRFWQDYLAVFAKSTIDTFIFLPVKKIPGRESEEKIKMRDFVEKLKDIGTQCFFVDDYEKAAKVAASQIRGGSIVITVGATDIYKAGDGLIKLLSSNKSDKLTL